MRKASINRIRILTAVVLIALWLTGGAIGGPYFGKVSEVSSNDQTTFLPESADATLLQKELSGFQATDAVPAIILFTSDTSLAGDKLSKLSDALDSSIAQVGLKENTSPLIPSADGLAAQAFSAIPSSMDTAETVSELTELLKEGLPADISVFITGPAGFTADLLEAFSGIDGLLLAVALITVFIILILVYRSVFLPLIVLSTSVFALTAALFTVWWLAKWEILMLSGQTQGILFILVIGAATDYSLLYVSRYREELRVHETRWDATSSSLKGAFEPIVASGGTVIAGLMCLLLSDLKSNSGLGPVASIGILFAMLSALTFLPAVLFLFGRAAFWPRVPRTGEAAESDAGPIKKSGVWHRVSSLVKKRPRTIWISTTAVLLLGVFGAAQFQASGVPASELVLGASEAREGQNALGKHFPGGSGNPVLITVGTTESARATELLLENEAVDDVAPVFDANTAAPKEVNGRVLLQGTLNVSADSEAALQAITELRESLAAEAPTALIGGVSATALDTNTASIHDRKLIIPIVLAVIALILMLLLRSILAPLLLVATTVLSFGTAMGVSAFFFNNILGLPGADPAVPLFGFVFLVALGIDYNIFLVTRLREESLVHGTRVGVLNGLTVTGGVITSAGVVLAATFAALAVLPILFLLQLAFIVAFGVLLDTFVVRSLLVPAIFYDLGKTVWWPSKLSR